MSSICCSGVLWSCWVQCLYEPFASRLMTWQPVSAIQSTLLLWSTKPKTSMRSRYPACSAKRQMPVTASFSPSETRAEATSRRSTFTFSNNRRAIISFSCGRKLTPLVCSPSRSVESMISMRDFILFSDSMFYGSFQRPPPCRGSVRGSRHRRDHSSSNASYNH